MYTDGCIACRFPTMDMEGALDIVRTVGFIKSDSQIGATGGGQGWGSEWVGE